VKGVGGERNNNLYEKLFVFINVEKAFSFTAAAERERRGKNSYSDLLMLCLFSPTPVRPVSAHDLSLDNLPRESVSSYFYLLASLIDFFNYFLSHTFSHE
jgi:hypothetical protein